MNYGVQEDYDGAMAKIKMKKVTVFVPGDLVRPATQASRQGITPTVRRGLQLIAAGEASRHPRSLRGKFRFGRSLHDLRKDYRKYAGLKLI